VPTDRAFLLRVPQDVNGGEDPEDVQVGQFVENVGKYLQENPTFQRFFGERENYIKELAQKIGALPNDANAFPFNSTDLSNKIKVTLHQHVICCGELLLVVSTLPH
jgi:hypothetical protein